MTELAVECIVSPPLETNCYLVADLEAKKAIAVDPSCVGRLILERCEEKGWELEAVVLTHGRIDHVHDAAFMKNEGGKRLLGHPLTEPALTDPDASGASMMGVLQSPCELNGRLEEGDVVTVGGARLRVLHTPGHSPGSICLLGEGICVTGDLLFRDGVGRWDFPDGDREALIQSLRRLAKECPDGTALYPGHGPSTTMGREKRGNPYLLEWLEE